MYFFIIYPIFYSSSQTPVRLFLSELRIIAASFHLLQKQIIYITGCLSDYAFAVVGWWRSVNRSLNKGIQIRPLTNSHISAFVLKIILKIILRENDETDGFVCCLLLVSDEAGDCSRCRLSARRRLHTL